MKLGVLLPTFRDDPRDAMGVARRCEELGLDGVFAYDHLWPMGSPTRPSLAPFPVLAAVAARNPSLHVGPLVARAGMVGVAQLVTQFRSLALVAPGRVVAAVGTGDSKSRDELEGYGLTFASADSRRAQVRAVVAELKGEMDIWIGAGSSSTNEMARDLGVAINVWDADLDTVATLVVGGPVTWAGPPHDDMAGWLDDLARVGVDWAVFSPGVDVEGLASWRR